MARMEMEMEMNKCIFHFEPENTHSIEMKYFVRSKPYKSREKEYFDAYFILPLRIESNRISIIDAFDWPRVSS